ncbi:hypothetical protein NQ176_g6827 [Zarea fungicola]|uniref:Uncharacterized protein n=1 Tax=Zarea fungicola TaxID=93591 RepID=A0ACC1N3K8_9HYPO|nr:hypothetical protein NQ176_g6827 [Lecanicillium fungicola]
MEIHNQFPPSSRTSDNDSGGDSARNPWKRCPVEIIQKIAAATDSLLDIRHLSQADRGLYSALDYFLYQFDFGNKDKPATMFRWACTNHGYNTVRKAIEYSVDVNMVWGDDYEWDSSDDELDFDNSAEEFGREGSTPVDDEPSYNITPLGLAAHTGDVNMVSLLLQSGADVNKVPGPGKSPIMIAVKRRAKAVVEYLLGCTAVDVNNVTSRRGRGILNTAIRNANPSMKATIFMKLLPLINDPDEKKFRGITALFAAAREDMTDAVSALLKHPAVDPNLIKGPAYADIDNRDCRATPLMAACFNSRTGAELLPFFHNAKVDFNVLNECGESALDYAIFSGNWNVVQFLLEFATIPLEPSFADEIFGSTFLAAEPGAKSLCFQLVLRFDMDAKCVRRWRKFMHKHEEWAVPDEEVHDNDPRWTVSDVVQLRNLISSRFKECQLANSGE